MLFDCGNEKADLLKLDKTDGDENKFLALCEFTAYAKAWTGFMRERGREKESERENQNKHTLFEV